jgi:hypothetical protein
MKEARVSKFQKTKRLCFEPKGKCSVPWSSGSVEFGDGGGKFAGCWTRDKFH